MLSFECIKNEIDVYFLLTSAKSAEIGQNQKKYMSDAQSH